MQKRNGDEDIIYLIGENINEIKEIENQLKLTQIKSIWNYYEIKPNNIDNIFEPIIDYYEQVIDDENISHKFLFNFTIIYYFNSINEAKLNNLSLLFQKIEKCDNYSSYFQPFFLLLISDEEYKNNIIDYVNKLDIKIDKKFNISFLNFSLREINVIQKCNIELIKKKILTIYSYFYQLGDENIYQKNDKDLYNINILLLGKSQVGKSTLINILTKEKKAREGGNHTNVTKKEIAYHINNVPLEINDIEGFIGEESINSAVQKIDELQKNLREKELNIVIYVISYQDEVYFNQNEYKIFEQLSKYLHQSPFLFVCTRAEEENDEVEKDIRNSFRKMIINGMNSSNLNNNNNIIDPLNYLYCLQKREIRYNELSEKVKQEINEENFNNLKFSEKFDLKFKYYKEKNKIIELVDTIIAKDKTLFFTNLKKDAKHRKTFGLKKIINKIIDNLNYIKKNNYETIEKKLKENTKKNFQELNNLNNSYQNLLDSFEFNDVEKSKKIIELIVEEEKKKAKKGLTKYNVYAILAGIIPVIDMGVEILLKKEAKEKISKEFDDNLIKFDDKDINLSLEEKNSIKEIKKDTRDTQSNIIKTILKGGTWAIGILVKTIGNLFRIGIPAIGTIFGMIINGYVMNKDINALIEFYGKRLKYRYYENLSVTFVIDYFENEFDEYN